MDRKAINFYRSYYEVAMKLPIKHQREFLMKLLEYQFTGIEPSVSSAIELAWISQKHSMVKQLQGFEHGKKGGAPLGGSLKGSSKGTSNQEQEKEQVQVQNVFNFKQRLLELGYDENLVKDWLEVRKRKKAANTETALNGFHKQVTDTGRPINEILKLCVENSWQGFNKTWLKNITNEPHKPTISIPKGTYTR